MIPRRIHLIWVGSAPPPEALANLALWRDQHPEWTITLWDDASRIKLQNEDLYRDAEQYVPAHAVGQFRADLLRYELLLRFGGFYADLDTYPLRPIDPALEGCSEFAVREDAQWIGNTYLASVPGNPIFRALVDGLHSHVHLSPVRAATQASGPQYLTPIWAALAGHVEDRTSLWFPYSWRDVRAGTETQVQIPADGYAVHEWGHSRRGKR